jgi:hypothetical protein
VGHTLVEIRLFEVLNFINFNFFLIFRNLLGFFVFLVTVVTVRLGFFLFLTISFVIFALVLRVVLEFRGSVDPSHHTREKDESLFLGQGASFQSLDHVVDFFKTVGHQIIDDSVTGQKVVSELFSSVEFNKLFEAFGSFLEVTLHFSN